MSEPTNINTDELVREFNARHRTAFGVRTRFAAGLQGGAWLLTDEFGRPAVLRGAPDDVEALATAVDRARAAGYPTPVWIGWGVSAAGWPYSIQEFVVGRSATPLTAATTPALLAGPEVLAACAASAAYFIVDFKLRHEPERMPEVLARLCRMADDLGS